jgi:hypothetical protein
VIDMYPQPSATNISREDWIATTPVVRDEIIRAWQEMEQGIAVAKDKRCGREKSHKRPSAGSDSFYALHVLDMLIWRRPDDEALQEKAAALRERLAPDVARMQANDSLEEYHALAKAGGKELADVLRQYIALEQLIRQDPIKGLQMLAKRYGLDFADVLRKALESDDAGEAA